MAAIYPRRSKTDRRYDSGVIDVAFQLFSCGMVWDGNLTSKAGRDYLVMNGFAVRYDGMQSLTGKGTLAMLRHPRTYVSIWRQYRTWRRFGLVADEARIKRAMT